MFHAQTSDIAEKIVFSSSKQSENFSKKYQRRQWHPTPVLLPGKSHGWRSLVGCSPWGREESDTTEWLHFHFPLSCIAEGNGNPLQCSCLENPRDGGAWWVPIYGVAQSRTRLKQLSSSSSKKYDYNILLYLGIVSPDICSFLSYNNLTIIFCLYVTSWRNL